VSSYRRNLKAECAAVTLGFMSGATKTAIGFCVGILTILAVISVYSQITEVRAETLVIQKDASVVRHLTPDYVMSKCGTPASDEVHVLTREGSADRELRYQATTITFYKSKFDQNWNYIAAQDGLGKSIDSPRSLPASLPCLQK
jgi:hypothetical protein